MPAKYCGKQVIGSNFGCVVSVCVIYFLASLIIPLCSYSYYADTLGNFTILVFSPLFIACILILYYYFNTSLTDPGVVPKRSNQVIEGTGVITMSRAHQLQIPIEQSDKDDTEQESKQQVKDSQSQLNAYVKNKQIAQLFNAEPDCRTCNTQRPPGIAHCPDCDHCVVYQDHHCPWLGTCIGLRNYHGFIISCIVTVIYCILVVIYGISGCIISFVKNDLESTIPSPVSGILQIVFILAGLFGTFFGGSMMINHLSLLKSDFTTRAELRNRLNVPASLRKTSTMTPEERVMFVKTAVQSDPILKYLDIRRYKNSGERRMKLGKYMPVLRNLPVEEAEEMVWRWTIVLGGFDD